MDNLFIPTKRGDSAPMSLNISVSPLKRKLIVLGTNVTECVHVGIVASICRFSFITFCFISIKYVSAPLCVVFFFFVIIHCDEIVACTHVGE